MVPFVPPGLVCASRLKRNNGMVLRRLLDIALITYLMLKGHMSGQVAQFPCIEVTLDAAEGWGERQPGSEILVEVTQNVSLLIIQI